MPKRFNGDAQFSVMKAPGQGNWEFTMRYTLDPGTDEGFTKGGSIQQVHSATETWADILSSLRSGVRSNEGF